MRWAEFLDRIVARDGDPPPVVHALRLPPIDGWERAAACGANGRSTPS